VKFRDVACLCSRKLSSNTVYDNRGQVSKRILGRVTGIRLSNLDYFGMNQMKGIIRLPQADVGLLISAVSEINRPPLA